MRAFFRAKWLIIGVALCLLSACSTLRLGYDNGPTLVRWWLDNYLDLDASQEAQLGPELERWFAWHRRSQLPGYVEQLALWRARADGPVSGSEVCAWFDLSRQRLLAGLDAGVPAAARLLPLVRPEQWNHLAKQMAQRQAERRKDYLQPRPEDRFEASLKRAIDRAEMLYGPLSEPQRALLAKATATSPLDPARWLEERERRQRALVQSLRQLHREEAADTAGRTEGLRRILRQYPQAPDSVYAEMQERWQAQACETAARLHNGSSSAQRAHLEARLAGWEEDLRTLAASNDAP